MQSAALAQVPRGWGTISFASRHSSNGWAPATANMADCTRPTLA